MAGGREDKRFRLDAALAERLASLCETPLYVIDEAHFRSRIRVYREAAESAWPRSEIAFASKANSTLAVLRIAHEEGCKIDVASEGELRAALAAGVPASECHLHGNNKSEEELRYAIEQGVGQIVVDHFGEIEMLAENSKSPNLPQLVLRLAPGVDPITHAKISTGQADTKFGFNIADGSAEKATVRCLELGLPLIGFHCHVGSQLLDPAAQEEGGSEISKFAVEMHRKHGFAARFLNVGGGLGVRYLDSDEPMAIADYCRLVVDAVRRGLEGSGLDPILGQEPGRALIAESGVTIYRVGVVKTVPAASGPRTYVSVDGGLSDNPRPALYGARYTVLPLAPPGERGLGVRGGEGKVTISGKHCETDTLFPDVCLPDDLKPGDLLQVLCTGGYNASMASNYNRFPRPATVLIRENGSLALIQRRDSWDEMLARESVHGVDF